MPCQWPKFHTDMKKLITIVLTALMLLGTSSSAFADHHRHHDHDRDRKEWRKEMKKRHKKEYKKAKKARKEYYKRQHKYARHRDKELRKMIRHAARGGKNVAVWQVDDDTYVVKYLRGDHYYTQYLYPGSGRYGKRNSVSLNWNPQSAWTLLPSINLNLNF